VADGKLLLICYFSLLSRIAIMAFLSVCPKFQVSNSEGV
jgi:hypothetical protein